MDLKSKSDGNNMFAFIKKKLSRKENLKTEVLEQTSYTPTFSKFSDLTDQELINKYKYGLPNDITVRNIFFELIERFMSKNTKLIDEIEKMKEEIYSTKKRGPYQKRKKNIDAKDEKK